jgi:glycosyltransferase involved in cell wall biosynthesis
MTISIITVTYNSEKTIRDTLESISNQTYKNIEHIIIDGKSNDRTLNIINNYNHNVIVISEPDKGIYDAMNKGIKIATGEVIGILNSDDLYFDNNIISKIAYIFESDNEIDILYGNLLYVKKNDISKIVRKWISCSYYKNYFENGNVPPHPTLFLRKKVYNKNGLFNLKFNLAADYEFMLRIFKNHSFKSKYLNEFFVKMRLGGATNKSIKNIYLGNIQILNSWKENNLSIPFLLVPKRFFKRILQFL